MLIKRLLNEELTKIEQQNNLKKLTNSPEFVKWFGDSMMVDNEDNPIIFFHGTKNKFDKFDSTKIGSATDAGWLGYGFYFYTDWSQAVQYGTVTPYFLKIENPYFATKEDNDRLAELNDSNASKEFTEDLIDNGYDGVYYNGDLRGETVVFDSNQIWKIDIDISEII